jgi:hypothetical protein
VIGAQAGRLSLGNVVQGHYEEVVLNQGGFSDFMSFKTLISTAWIKAVYAIGAVLITIGSLAVLVSGGRLLGGGAVLIGLLYFVAGNVGWRMICEAAILFFSMHEQLVTLVKLSSGQSLAGPGAATPYASVPFSPVPQAPAGPGAQPPKTACRFCGELTSAEDPYCAFCGRTTT